ncbi:hypothetical protein LPAF129_12240 [Ligilactobacillus pabuli]|uniref:Uncharacterized protein n=1 Tax=Ligilactobacillus pabuli TaxID=2886039 RepID=A0ABQ5JI31_9LACO|nr:hypothetical protein LPAF129_12240 [Ligilactobacillus pabuli]
MSRQLWIGMLIIVLVVISVIVEFVTHTFSWGIILLQILFLVYALLQFNRR